LQSREGEKAACKNTQDKTGTQGQNKMVLAPIQPETKKAWGCFMQQGVFFSGLCSFFISVY
jgi:hypothetical protein